MQGVHHSPMDTLRLLMEDEVRRALPEAGSAYRVYARQYEVVEVPEAEKKFDYRSEIGKLSPYRDFRKGLFWATVRY